MKKFYTLAAAIVLTAVAAHSQNLALNGSFESWNEVGPNDFTVTIPEAGGAIGQGTGENVQDGDLSLMVTSPMSSHVKITATEINVTEGESYTFSYWFKDEDNAVRARHWVYWMAGDATINDDPDAAILRPDYFPNSTGWQQVSHTITAPPTATKIRLEFRVYPPNADEGGGSMYYDNLMFVGETAGINENSISGLKMFPNPLSGSTLSITTAGNAAKTVAIYDVLGKQVLNTRVTGSAVNVGALNAGVYIVKITEEGKTATRKLVVK